MAKNRSDCCHSCPRLVACNLPSCVYKVIQVLKNSFGRQKSCPKLGACKLHARVPVHVCVGLRYCLYLMTCCHRFPSLPALQVCGALVYVDFIWLISCHRFPSLSALQVCSALMYINNVWLISCHRFPTLSALQVSGTLICIKIICLISCSRFPTLSA